MPAVQPPLFAACCVGQLAVRHAHDQAEKHKQDRRCEFALPVELGLNLGAGEGQGRLHHGHG
eukprot:359486-Chlamydomonas_euryale.AAC.6